MHKQQLQLTLYFPEDDDAPAVALRQTTVKPSQNTTVRDLSPTVLREAAIAYTGGKIKDLPAAEQPVNRLQHFGPYALSTAELLAILLGTPHALTDAEHLLSRFGELSSFATAPLAEITESPGIGQTLAARIKAALELGRRMLTAAPAERPVVRSPADAANLLMAEMGALEQEHLRTVLLDTRNRVIDIPTIYIGSLNTAAVRVGEVFKHAIRQNAASMVVAHNHPSSDPSPSPVIWRKSQVAGPECGRLSDFVRPGIILKHPPGKARQSILRMLCSSFRFWGVASMPTQESSV